VSQVRVKTACPFAFSFCDLYDHNRVKMPFLCLLLFTLSKQILTLFLSSYFLHRRRLSTFLCNKIVVDRS
jgi:hypothetical protein